MNSEKKKELASLGFQLVDIKDKEWMLIADQDGFNNSCIVLDSIEDVEKIIELHNKMSEEMDYDKLYPKKIRLMQ